MTHRLIPGYDADSDDSGSDSSGGGITWSAIAPGWVKDLSALSDYVDELTSFASNPVRYIREKVAVWLVAGVLSAIEATTGRIRWLWGIFADALGSAGDSVDFAFEAAGDVLLDALGIVPELLEQLSRDLGPVAGPVVIGVGGALLLWAAWHAIKRAPSTVWTLYQAIPFT